MVTFVEAALIAAAVGLVGFILLLIRVGSTGGGKSSGPELFMDCFRLHKHLVGSFTLVFGGKTYHAGDKNPCYRPIVMKVNNHLFFPHVVTYRNLGLGEAYMKGWFELDPGTPQNRNGDLYDLVTFFLINHVDEISYQKVPLSLLFRMFATWFVYKFHGHKRAIDMHYGENPEMYRDMLGPTQAYTCGYVTSKNSALPDNMRERTMPIHQKTRPKNFDVTKFPDMCSVPIPANDLPRSEFMLHPFDTDADLKLDLEGMQIAKFDKICRKLQLRPGQRILEIGCGYGGFAIYAAKNYGVNVTAFAITQQMIDGATAAAAKAGLSKQCSFHCSDLKFLSKVQDESLDAVVAIGVFEHVHEYEYKFVFDNFRRILKHDGMVLLHMMCSPEKPNRKDAFIQTYLFPNSHQNIISDITHEIEIRKFHIFDIENIGHHYTFTLECWWQNLKKHYEKYPDKYTEEYKRMFEYYLLTCKAMSAHGRASLCHFLFCKNNRGQYRPLHRIT